VDPALRVDRVFRDDDELDPPAQADAAELALGFLPPVRPLVERDAVGPVEKRPGAARFRRFDEGSRGGGSIHSTCRCQIGFLGRKGAV
jgi:hypothetical protein